MFVSLGKHILCPPNNNYYSPVSSNDVTFILVHHLLFPPFRPMTAKSRQSDGELPMDKSKDMSGMDRSKDKSISDSSPRGQVTLSWSAA